MGDTQLRHALRMTVKERVFSWMGECGRIRC